MIWLLDTNMLVYARNGVSPVVARLDEVWESEKWSRACWSWAS